MKRTLAGLAIVVTRPEEQAGELVELLETRGALTIKAPAIEILPAPKAVLDRAAKDIAGGRFAWIVLTSRAGVEALMEALPRRGIVSPDTKVAAIGEGTAETLRSRGVEPDLVPSTFTTEALGRALPRGEGTALLARADIAPPGLDEALTAKGWRVERIDAYRTRRVRSLPPASVQALRAGGADALTFTSASTVDGFMAAAGSLELPRAVCIGPVTAKAARDHGLRVAGVASPHTIEGLVARLERVFAPRPGGRRTEGRLRSRGART